MGKRPGYVRGAFIRYVVNGQTRVRSWPSKRGKSKYPYQQASVDRLRVGQRAVKLLSEYNIAHMRAALKRFLNANRGIRGTAAIRLRDWLYQNATGRSWAVSTPEGQVYYSAAVVKDASDILDWLEPMPGSLVVRTEKEWLCTVQCRPGRVLTLSDSKPSDRKCPPARIAPPSQAVGGYP